MNDDKAEDWQQPRTLLDDRRFAIRRLLVLLSELAEEDDVGEGRDREREPKAVRAMHTLSVRTTYTSLRGALRRA